MRVDAAVKRRIIRNAWVSLLIYALPVLLMFLSFQITGERPWENGKAAEARATEDQK